jgi:protein TonB
MTSPLMLLAALGLVGQEPGPPAETTTPLPDVEVTAPADQAVVTLECRVNRRRGTLRDCLIVSETPSGQGFGEAALDAVGRARLAREAIDAAQPDGKVTFTMRFQLAD